MNAIHKARLLGLFVVLFSSYAAGNESLASVEATIKAPYRTVQVGNPVWVDFQILNQSDKPVTLSVPDLPREKNTGLAGLPIAHLFSGPAFSCLTIEGEQGRTWDVAIHYQPPASVPEIRLGPHASVGLRVNLLEYYPVLSTPGKYRLQWRPYNGSLLSNALTIEVAPLKQAVVQTDYGEMTFEFLYDKAPVAVDNFIELARTGFYNGLLFHRLYPGWFVQGGCPNGDGTGIRIDGRKLPAEFSDYPQIRGTVNMARLKDDPDSASCQFFINNTRMADWDGQQTAFAQLVGEDSFETLDKIMAVPVDANQRPSKPVYIRSVRIVPVTRTKQQDKAPVAVEEGRPATPTPGAG